MTAVDTKPSVIETSPAVKALTHPVRRAIIACLARGLDSPMAIAAETGHSLGVVSYHVRMLRGYGVIEVARLEPRRGALQHFYTFTAGAVADFEQVRALANDAIRSARRSQPDERA